MTRDNIRCRGCSEISSTIYCAKCVKNTKCVHGAKVDDCVICDIDGDLAFDANRERGK